MFVQRSKHFLSPLQMGSLKAVNKIIVLFLISFEIHTHTHTHIYIYVCVCIYIYTLCGQNLEILLLNTHKVSNRLEKVNIHGVSE